MARFRKDDIDDVAAPAPKSDAYTGLLLVALLAQMAGAVFLYLDYNSYQGTPKPVKDRPAQVVPAAPPAGQAK